MKYSAAFVLLVLAVAIGYVLFLEWEIGPQVGAVAFP
jgi:hypothetical protein